MRPDQRHALWVAAMRRGDFEGAWKQTDFLEKNRGARGSQLHNLVWDGTPPDGKHVTVRCLHGLGDTLQFSRFLPLLSARARSLAVEIQEPLRPLFSMQPWMSLDQVGQENSLQIEIMELAYLFRVTAASLPVPNLRIDGRPGQHGRRDRMRVAIFWAASGWGGGRHVPFTAFEAFADLRNIDFFSFQRGPCEEEAAQSRLPIKRASSSTNTILALARVLQEMDLVISVDTMPAHLAGTLRKPVWLLLERPCDWRWMEDGDQSVWYPEMRIFRQQDGGWDRPIFEMHRRLRSLAQPI